ncbi:MULTISPECIES: response regulator transcription factor [Paenibacillus]|uniref:response regulator transcription factor n=1 Tax=Paenibacillus TaxID=44249 RepID=UPI0022B8CD56|nr:response regulator [Paenibacillus caseinilyticus]MCZ8520868.1 response regulator [Paenibacillus caseinilyticus]
MLKTLIVEDEPRMREGLKKIIPWESHGFSLCGDAENGRQALERIEKERPDLVITDIRMPVLSGLELMMEVSGRFDCQFIVLSGYSDFQYAKTALVCGAVDYLLKPLEEDDLIRALERTRRRLEKERQPLPAPCPPDQPPAAGAVEFVTGYVQERFREPITVKELAGKLYLNPIYLGQLFKKSTGMYFNDYVHRVRVEEACRRLKGTTNKIFDIALSVGYSDTDYFVQQFKKITGCTPSQFRERTP